MEDIRKNEESPSSNGSADSFIVGEEPVMPLPSETEHTDNNSCITSETTILSIPVHAPRTVMLLETSPVQDVVESIVSDKNVRNAVMQNEALQEFILSQKTSKTSVSFHCSPSLDADSKVKESVADDEFNDQGSPKKSEDSSDESKSRNIGTGFMEMLQDIKLLAVDTVINLPVFIQNMFRTPAGGNESVNVAAKDTNNTSILVASVMGLAALVIVMAVLKKN